MCLYNQRIIYICSFLCEYIVVYKYYSLLDFIFVRNDKWRSKVIYQFKYNVNEKWI